MYAKNTQMDTAISTKISELEHSFSELTENVANLEKDINELVHTIEMSQYNSFNVDNK